MDKSSKQFHSLSACSIGFTLIEIVITTFIGGLLTVLVYDFIRESMFMQTYISEQSTAISEARKGMEKFTTELRETTTADTGAYGLETAAAQEIIFYSDVDKDIGIEKIHYYLDGTNLIKGITESTGNPPDYTESEQTAIVSSYIVNDGEPVFTYYDQNYPIDLITNPLADPVDVSSVTLVEIHLDVNVTPERIPDTYTLESYVQIRNFKNNL